MGQRLIRLAAIGGSALLVALHVAVLGRRVVDGTLLSPLVAAQWLAAVALLAAMAILHRRGVSLFHGRSAAAFWIVVVLMHGLVALPGGPGFVGVLKTVPMTDALPVGLGLLTGALMLLFALRSAKSAAALSRFGLEWLDNVRGPRSSLPSSLAPRAPPA